MAGAKRAVLISEVGWRGVKELSSALVKDGFLADIIIKGSVDKKVMEVITRPQGLGIYAIPKWFFRMYVFFYLLRQKITCGMAMIVVTKEQTRDWMKGFGLDVKLLVETQKDYELK